MIKNLKFNYNHRSVELILILILLCIFSFTCLLLVSFGSNIYKEITKEMDSNFQLRTPLSYISTKIRQYDAEDAIWLEEKDGITALVLESDDAGELCQTWLYEYKGYLYELYIEKGTNFNLDDGIAIIPSYGLKLSMANQDSIYIRSYDSNKKSMRLLLSLRSGKHENGGFK
ncbi:DUF4860 domain-containing protein [Anaerovorax odorimutans]|uniref:DUF4860 domain-containing protein n=1 Tax=Anaerovorax odorimutans TaxID=109327 RepID=UPI0004034841|nr:DUF4860 domain-containing protein [Anaerovorax odorimutans]